jgi:hypothetical protein
METTESTAVVAKNEIALDEHGVFQPRTAEDAFRLAKLQLNSKMLPARFNTPEMVMVATQYALELRLPPLVSLRQIAVVQGTPCTFGDLPLALVRRGGKLEWMKEILIDKDQTEICYANKNLNAEAVAAICTVKRKDDAEPLERFFSLDDAKVAGLNGPTWKSYPKVMLKYRARSQALKDKFPDDLNGIAIAEYDFHVIPDEDSPKMLDAAGDLNAQFLDAAKP